MTFILIIAGFLVSRVLGRIFLTLGFGFITIKGMDVVIQWIHDAAHDTLFSLPADVLNYVGLMKADIAITILFAAMSVKVSVMILKKLAGIG